MLNVFCHIPNKLEEFAVASRRLTDEELTSVVHEVFDDSLIWHDEPRSWLTYGSFLGFQIGKAILRYAIGCHCKDDDEKRQEVNNFVEACFNYALFQGETL